MDTRNVIFLAIMIAVGAAALLAFIIFLIVQGRRLALTKAGAPAAAPADAPAAHPTPAAVRMLGLLALLLAFLVLDWVYLDSATGYAAMVTLVYPAAFATALVLLLDKATRSWAFKSGMSGLREWLFCDLIVFLLVLAFVNLWRSGARDRYDALFWDVLGLLFLFFVFWLLDRKATRYRFLVAHGYLVLLPILLLIWATVQDVPARLGVDQRPASAAVEETEEEAAVEPAGDTVTPAPAPTGEGVPDWMKTEEPPSGLSSPATPTPPAAATEEDVPDWMRTEQTPAAPSSPATPAPPAAAAEDEVPDWMRTEQAPAAEPAEASPAQAEPVAEEAGQEEPEPEPEEIAAVEASDDTSWWETIWPFFAWAAVFFVLEIIGLIAFAEPDRSLTLLLKDVVFVAGYAILLLIAAA